MSNKPISKDLDRLLGIYASMRPEDAENSKFVLALQRLIVDAAPNGWAEYDADRAEEWRKIGYALGDDDPDCSSIGHWSGEIEKHAEAIRKVMSGEAA